MTVNNVRAGLRLRCSNGVNSEVRRACLVFCKWLRKERDFPIRVVVYLKKDDRIKNMDGKLVVATFFAPYDKTNEPYIRIATGDYNELLKERGKDNALVAYLRSIAHEVVHYKQWLKGVNFDEQKANRESKSLIRKYAQTRLHP